ncbi:hypothetical protein CB1_000661007 [Camelus ferus]|nr:hypothetical protein CB1_000661007 [Camelus ferus]
MLKSKLNVLTLKKEPLPAVIFHEPEAIELCTTTPLMKTRTHSGCKTTWILKFDFVKKNKTVYDEKSYALWKKDMEQTVKYPKSSCTAMWTLYFVHATAMVPSYMVLTV